MKRYLLLGFLLLAASCSCGCAALFVGGAGGALYYKGALREDLNAPLDEVWEASVSTVEEMGLDITDKTKDGLAGAIVAMRADGKEVRIVLKALQGEITRVTMRIGVLGDQETSRLLLEMIKEKLP